MINQNTQLWTEKVIYCIALMRKKISCFCNVWYFPVRDKQKMVVFFMMRTVVMCKEFNNFVSVDKIIEKIRGRLSEQAMRGSGLIYELYAVRYSDSVDQWLHQNSNISNLFKSYLTDKGGDYIHLEEREIEDEAVEGLMNCFFCKKPLTLQEMHCGDACSDCM